MVVFNSNARELALKIVYYGPALCGKTTNIEYIFRTMPEGKKGQMLSLNTEGDRTLFFDFLPLELGTIMGWKVRIQLYTVPGQVFYDATRRLVLRGADGVVFVADSQKPMAEANLESYENMKQNLAANGLDYETIPLVLQFNKRDLANILPVDVMNQHLNERNVPYYEAIAIEGKGVIETVKEISRLTLQSVRQKLPGEKVQVSIPKQKEAEARKEEKEPKEEQAHGKVEHVKNEHEELQIEHTPQHDEHEEFEDLGDEIEHVEALEDVSTIEELAELEPIDELEGIEEDDEPTIVRPFQEFIKMEKDSSVQTESSIFREKDQGEVEGQEVQEMENENEDEAEDMVLRESENAKIEESPPEPASIEELEQKENVAIENVEVKQHCDGENEAVQGDIHKGSQIVVDEHTVQVAVSEGTIQVRPVKGGAVIELTFRIRIRLDVEDS